MQQVAIIQREEFDNDLTPPALLLCRPGRDGRSRSLYVTRAGAARARELQAERFAALDDVLEPLGATDRATLTGLVERLLAGITHGGEAPRRTCRLCDADVCGHPDRCPVTRAAHP